MVLLHIPLLKHKNLSKKQRIINEQIYIYIYIYIGTSFNLTND